MPRTYKKTKSVQEKTDSEMQGKKGGVAMQRPQDIEGVNPLVGAAVGAAVGGVIGAAAAVALSDKETRHRVKEVAVNLRDQAAVRLEDITSKAKETAKVARDDMQHRLQSSNKEEKKE